MVKPGKDNAYLILFFFLAFMLRYFIVSKPAGQDWAAYLFAASKFFEKGVPVNFAYEPELFPLVFLVFTVVKDFDLVAGVVYALLAVAVYRFSGNPWLTLLAVFNPYVFRLSIDFLKEMLATTLIFLYLSKTRYAAALLPLIHQIGLAFSPFILLSREENKTIKLILLPLLAVSGIYTITITKTLYLIPLLILGVVLLTIHVVDRKVNLSRLQLYFPLAFSTVVTLHIFSEYPYRVLYVAPLLIIFLPRMLQVNVSKITKGISVFVTLVILALTFAYAANIIELPALRSLSSIGFTETEYRVVDSLRINEGVVLSDEKMCKLIAYRLGIMCVTSDMLERGVVDTSVIKAIVADNEVIYLD